ncbi:MAG: hypothetical protein M0Q93_03095 [Terrimicrobiaceae bacterium]|nr:hypothetical protein [Terrimicrobiaceae bacterium]
MIGRQPEYDPHSPAVEWYIQSKEREPDDLISGNIYNLKLIFKNAIDDRDPVLPTIVGGRIEFHGRNDITYAPAPFEGYQPYYDEDSELTAILHPDGAVKFKSLIEFCYQLIVSRSENVIIPSFKVSVDQGREVTVGETVFFVKSAQRKTRTTSDCQPLLSAANLSIYRNNVFRVTGLAVDATNKQAKRRADELKMLQEAGMQHAAQGAVFALNPPPSVDDIRRAMQRPDDPEQRLIDEFFWFWPAVYGQSANDPALQALANGDSSAAYEIWQNGERDPDTGYVATHNIAIMFHMIALDWTNYHLAADVDSEREEKIRGYWKGAFERWEKVVEDDRIWDAVKERIRAIDDARLTTGFGRRMRDSLPEALDMINAEAALKFAELHRLDWAQDHITWMNESHQGLDDVDKTAAQVLAPTRNRVLQHIANAKEQIQNNPADGCNIAETLLDQAEPLEQLFEMFHGQDSHHKTELFDEVATTVNSLVVAFQNKASGDPRLAVPLYQRALSLATSIDLRQLIQRNIGVGTKTIKGKELQPIFDKLKQLQDSRTITARSKFNEIKSLVPTLAQLAEDEGEDSDLYAELANSLAVVLRGIAIVANNDEKDPDTSLHAITLARKLVKDAQLRQRIEQDYQTVQSNKLFANLGQQQRRSSSGCLVLIICSTLGAIGGAAVSGGSGLMGGGALGLMAGSAISKIIKPSQTIVS